LLLFSFFGLYLLLLVYLISCYCALMGVFRILFYIRKSLASTYTEQEIKQWCEERRKNYPTKANINKKLTEKQSNSERIDKEVKMRREQLKEILAKQAELGVEVAEIPSHYLSDSEKLVHGREKNARPLNKRGRFQNKHDKRGRYNRREQFAKKQKLEDNDSSKTSSFNKRKPTLLQKLLSTDIKRQKPFITGFSVHGDEFFFQRLA
ncbi:Nuclear fragile X mental retardation-interacting protein 1, conserved domain containing protein, partial [Melia azedarach]